MNTSTSKILLNKGIKITQNECCVCYEKFIDINCDNLWDLYTKILEENKHNVTEDILCCSCASTNELCNELCYQDTFECLNCKNSVCNGCIMKMIYPDDEKCDNYDGNKTTMEETGRINCPICKTKEFFRLKITKHVKGYCGTSG